MELRYASGKYSGHWLWNDREVHFIHFVASDTEATLEQIRDFLDKGSGDAEAVLIVRRTRKEAA